MSARIGDVEGLMFRDFISEMTASGGIDSEGVGRVDFGPLWRISFDLLICRTCVTNEGIWSCSRSARRIRGDAV
jgi:hypothetical protein